MAQRKLYQAMATQKILVSKVNLLLVLFFSCCNKAAIASLIVLLLCYYAALPQKEISSLWDDKDTELNINSIVQSH